MKTLPSMYSDLVNKFYLFILAFTMHKITNVFTRCAIIHQRSSKMISLEIKNNLLRMNK